MKPTIKKYLFTALSLVLAFALMAPLIPLRKQNIAKKYNLQLIEEEDVREAYFVDNLKFLKEALEPNYIKKTPMCNLYITPSVERIFIEHPCPPPKMFA